MTLSEYYNESYKSLIHLPADKLSAQVLPLSKGQLQFVQEAKNKFLSHRDWSDLRILELGSGVGGVSLELAKLGAKVTICDFSSLAIDLAQKLFSFHGLEVDAFISDLTLPEPGFSGKFDIIIDGHLLHCLTEDYQRASFFKLIKEYLSEEGIFTCETMVHKKKIFIPENFKFDEDTYTLWQFLGSWQPVRKISDSLDLENEIKQHQLSIRSFFYYSQMGMVPHQSFLDLPVEILPAAVRMVLSH